MDDFVFPVGYHEFHPSQVFNFQLNRWHSLGYARYEDMLEVGSRIETFTDWKNEMVRQADRALSEGRRLNAAFYYRAAEFYTLADGPDKVGLYERFIELFYGVFGSSGIVCHDIPYGDSTMRAMFVPAKDGVVRDTIVMHGGFDSFIEEFYSWMVFFSNRGYDVIAFEGPGQGGTRRTRGLVFDPEWEKPVRSVLDYFGLSDVALLGISMGGWLCFRAAAFESRVSRVIASSIAYDYMQFVNPLAQWLFNLFVTRFPGVTSHQIRKKMQTDPMHTWTVGNLMYIARTDDPLGALEVAKWMNAKNLHSERVTQDVLVLTGRDDHFIPFKMHAKQLKALTNARSITARVFTRVDHAQNHCQVGNIGRALDIMCAWLDEPTTVSTTTSRARPGS